MSTYNLAKNLLTGLYDYKSIYENSTNKFERFIYFSQFAESLTIFLGSTKENPIGVSKAINILYKKGKFDNTLRIDSYQMNDIRNAVMHGFYHLDEDILKMNTNSKDIIKYMDGIINFYEKEIDLDNAGEDIFIV